MTTAEQQTATRQRIIEDLLAGAFEPKRAKREWASRQNKIDRALGRIKDRATDIEAPGLERPKGNPTADFYLAACPVPPFKPMKTARDVLENIYIAVWAFSQLAYWRSSDQLKITPQEVEGSAAFKRLRNCYLVQGVDLSLANVGDEYISFNGRRPMCNSVRISLNARPL